MSKTLRRLKNKMAIHDMIPGEYEDMEGKR